MFAWQHQTLRTSRASCISLPRYSPDDTSPTVDCVDHVRNKAWSDDCICAIFSSYTPRNYARADHGQSEGRVRRKVERIVCTTALDTLCPYVLSRRMLPSIQRFAMFSPCTAVTDVLRCSRRAPLLPTLLGKRRTTLTGQTFARH